MRFERKLRPFRQRFVLLTLISLLPTLAEAEEIQVNTAILGSQERPAVAMNDAGRFVVVWRDELAAGELNGAIVAQIFDAGGGRVGGNLRVNEPGSLEKRSPAVAIDDAGNFAVVWEEYESFKSVVVKGRFFAADGTPAGAPMQMNAQHFEVAQRPAIAMDAAGNGVVVWDLTPNYMHYDVVGRRFTANGATLGNIFTVNTQTAAYQYAPSAAMDDQGRFVVAWTSGPASFEEDGRNIEARRFLADGTPLGNQQLVNTWSAGEQDDSAVAMDAAGNFVVVWQDLVPGDERGIEGQLFGSDGIPRGGELRADATPTGTERTPAVAMAPSGEFVIAWGSIGPVGTDGPGGGDGDGESVQARRFQSDGSPDGPQRQLNLYTASTQSRPAVGIGEALHFVAVWGSLGSFADDQDERSVQRSRILGRNLIFGDGFESADTRAWSSSPP